MAIGIREIENRFGFHKATIEGENATLPKHQKLRTLFKEFADYLDKTLPDGRTKNLSFDQLEAASMWAHKALSEKNPLVDEEENKDLSYMRTLLRCLESLENNPKKE